MRPQILSKTFSVHMFGRLDDGMIVENGAVVFADEDQALACAFSIEADVDGVCVLCSTTSKDSGRSAPPLMLYVHGQIRNRAASLETRH